MKNWRQIKYYLTDGMQQFLPVRTVTEIAGNGNVLIEHHRGVLGMENDRIIVGTSYGTAEIIGDGLELVCMSRDVLAVKGKIESISFSEGCR